MVIVVMGVTACGKTTLGRNLAAALELPFIDGDDFHPPENRSKMARGIALDDADRYPWLLLLAEELKKREGAGGVVLACSALKEEYRRRLRTGPERVLFVYIRCSPEVALKRAVARLDHDYIRAGVEAIMEGQFRDLEEPPDAIAVDANLNPKQQVQEVIKELQRRGEDKRLL